MKTINTNTERIGNFTSSEIYSLMANGKAANSLGKPALTYIDECNMERRLNRSITDDVSARPLTWGKLNEWTAFSKLGIEYSLTSQETDSHPEIDCWKGSKDGIKEDEGKTVIDIKCPFTLKSFCTMADCSTIDDVRDNHKDGEKYYWQLVSNAIINDCKHAELIIYMPYKSELQEIRDLAGQAPEDQLYKYYWVVNSHDEELPHLIDGGYYKNLYVIRFEVTDSAKLELTNRVKLAKSMLNEFHVPEVNIELQPVH